MDATLLLLPVLRGDPLIVRNCGTLLRLPAIRACRETIVKKNTVVNTAETVLLVVTPIVTILLQEITLLPLQGIIRTQKGILHTLKEILTLKEIIPRVELFLHKETTLPDETHRTTGDTIEATAGNTVAPATGPTTTALDPPFVPAHTLAYSHLTNIPPTEAD